MHHLAVLQMVMGFSLWGDFCPTSAGVRGARVMGEGGRGETCEGQHQDSLARGCQADGTLAASVGPPETAQGEGLHDGSLILVNCVHHYHLRI